MGSAGHQVRGRTKSFSGSQPGLTRSKKGGVGEMGRGFRATIRCVAREPGAGHEDGVHRHPDDLAGLRRWSPVGGRKKGRQIAFRLGPVVRGQDLNRAFGRPVRGPSAVIARRPWRGSAGAMPRRAQPACGRPTSWIGPTRCRFDFPWQPPGCRRREDAALEVERKQREALEFPALGGAGRRLKSAPGVWFLAVGPECGTRSTIR